MNIFCFWVLVLLIDSAICLKSFMKFVIIFKGGFQRVAICHAHVNREQGCGAVGLYLWIRGCELSDHSVFLSWQLKDDFNQIRDDYKTIKITDVFRSHMCFRGMRPTREILKIYFFRFCNILTSRFFSKEKPGSLI